MAQRNDVEHQRLVRLARTQSCPDVEVADCWQHVIQALEAGYFGAETLERLAEVIHLGSGLGVEEFMAEAEGAEAVVTFIRDERRCDREAFVATLRSLRQRYLLGPDYERGEQAGRAAVQGPAGQVGEEEALRRLWTWLTGHAPEAAPTALSQLPPELQARVAQVRELSRRLREAPHTVDSSAATAAMPSLSPQVQALVGPLRERLMEVLQGEEREDPRALERWLEVLVRWLRGDAAAGAELDTLLGKLEAQAGSLLKPQDAAREDEALRARVSHSIRDALRKRGFRTKD